MEQKQMMMLLLLVVVVVVVVVAAVLLMGGQPASPGGSTTPAAGSEPTTGTPVVTEPTTPETTTPSTPSGTITDLAAQMAAGAPTYCQITVEGIPMDIWMESPKMRAEASYDGEDVVILYDGSVAYMYMMEQWYSMAAEDDSDTMVDMPTAAEVQEMLDDTTVDVNCQIVADIADSQFMPPAGVEVIDMEEYLNSLMAGIDMEGVDLSAYQ